jgi:uncharacterized protein YraI
MMLLRVTLSATLLAAAGSAAAAKPFTLPAETNLRAAPGTRSEVVSLMPKGAEVEVGECDAGWCKVSWEGKEGFAIGRNLGMEAPREASSPRTTVRQPQQADLNRLRRGYEEYFDNQSRAADQGPTREWQSGQTLPRQRQYAGRPYPERQYVERQYVEREVQQAPQYEDEDDIVYGTPRGYVMVAPPRGYYAAPPVYYAPRVYFGWGWGPAYYYRRW